MDCQCIKEHEHTSSEVDITYKLFYSNINESYFIVRYVVRDDRSRKYPYPFEISWIHFDEGNALHHFETINK